jgi:hypothetical protein
MTSPCVPCAKYTCGETFPPTVRVLHKLPRFFRFGNLSPEALVWYCKCMTCGHDFMYTFPIDCSFNPEEDGDLTNLIDRGLFPKELLDKTATI